MIFMVLEALGEGITNQWFTVTNLSEKNMRFLHKNHLWVAQFKSEYRAVDLSFYHNYLLILRLFKVFILRDRVRHQP